MIWVKFANRSKKEVNRAARIAGYRVVSSGTDNHGSFVYVLGAASENPNFDTLRSLLLDAGCFDASWD